MKSSQVRVDFVDISPTEPIERLPLLAPSERPDGSSRSVQDDLDQDGSRWFVELATEFSLADSEAMLYRALLRGLIQVAPTDGAAIVLNGATGALYVLDAAGLPGASLAVNRHIVEGALDLGAALLLRDSAARSLLEDGRAAVRYQYILCIPLSAVGSSSGAVWLVLAHRPAAGGKRLELILAAVRLALAHADRLTSAERLAHIAEQCARQHIAAYLVGESQASRKLLTALDHVMPGSVPVLLRGEAGTGKERVARLLRTRRDGPFVVENCGMRTPDTVLQVALFGVEKGFYTGGNYRGSYEAAHGGTLFLRDVDQMPLSVQHDLLRTLQEGEVRRVGSARSFPVQVRVVAGTRRDLTLEVRLGRFIPDLYDILSERIHVPPLRERAPEIPFLAQAVIERTAASICRSPLAISAPALEVLKDYSWPGNLRELEQVIERAVESATGDAILPEDLPEALRYAAAAANGGHCVNPLDEAMLNARRSIAAEALRNAGGDQTEAADALGISLGLLRRLLGRGP